MALSGTRATSFCWPVVRNVSGLSPGLIHAAGSAVVARKVGTSMGKAWTRGPIAPVISCRSIPRRPDRLPAPRVHRGWPATWDHRAWIRCEGAWAVPSPRGRLSSRFASASDSCRGWRWLRVACRSVSRWARKRARRVRASARRGGPACPQ